MIELMLSIMLSALTYPSTRHLEHPTRVSSCRTAHGGCEARLRAFAGYFVEAGQAHDIDPMLLMAMSWHESRWNPYAEGSVGEVGIFQIHPRTKTGKKLKWATDASHRRACKTKVGNCQREVVMAAAAILSKHRERCGSIEDAIAAYQLGRCVGSTRYSRKILRSLAEYKAVAS